ncbi:MAG: 5'/3'-nucleotidase SurE [Clostridiales bacterium]|nr:5'/3'-nucleotidase SurE [Clostridiales bacterium]
MLILVTNDDGIAAAGIKSLANSLKRIGDVAVVAPERERSAVGHAITMHKPLRAKPVGYFGDRTKAWAVNGTPADCVKLGVEALLDKKPDLVFSGINKGPNLGTDVLYSGTVSAAIEAVMLGVPSAALSLASYEYDDFSAASEFALSLADNMYREGLEGNTLLNVNVPPVPINEIRGIRSTRLGTRRYKNSFQVRVDPRGQEYYWMSGEAVDEENDRDCDINLVAENFITITPVHFDLTRFDYIEMLGGWKFGPMGGKGNER